MFSRSCRSTIDTVHTCVQGILRYDYTSRIDCIHIALKFILYDFVSLLDLIHTLNLFPLSLLPSDHGSAAAYQSSIPRLVERSSVRARYLQPPGYSLSMKSRTLSKPEGGIARNRHTIHHTYASTRRKEQPSHLESSLASRQVGRTY